jgi:hypothetical protein
VDKFNFGSISLRHGRFFRGRPAARRLDETTLEEFHDLFATVADGDAVVIRWELAGRGIRAELRTLQQAVATLRQQERAEAMATVRFETPPGAQTQIVSGGKVMRHRRPSREGLPGDGRP